LPNGNAFPVDCDAYEPDTNPLEIRHRRVLKLSMTVRTEEKEVAGVVTHFRVEMMDFEVGLAVPFFERERTQLASSVM